MQDNDNRDSAYSCGTDFRPCVRSIKSPWRKQDEKSICDIKKLKDVLFKFSANINICFVEERLCASQLDLTSNLARHPRIVARVADEHQPRLRFFLLCHALHFSGVKITRHALITITNPQRRLYRMCSICDIQSARFWRGSESRGRDRMVWPGGPLCVTCSGPHFVAIISTTKQQLTSSRLNTLPPGDALCRTKPLAVTF